MKLLYIRLYIRVWFTWWRFPWSTSFILYIHLLSIILLVMHCKEFKNKIFVKILHTNVYLEYDLLVGQAKNTYTFIKALWFSLSIIPHFVCLYIQQDFFIYFSTFCPNLSNNLATVINFLVQSFIIILSILFFNGY